MAIRQSFANPTDGAGWHDIFPFAADSIGHVASVAEMPFLAGSTREKPFDGKRQGNAIALGGAERGPAGAVGGVGRPVRPENAQRAERT
jgi:hypothetical protein